MVPPLSEAEPPPCFLCGRPLGRRMEWHHPVPKSRGGRETVPVHPICHRAIHAALTNKELERDYASAAALGAHRNRSLKTAVMVGPEGGFTAEERALALRHSSVVRLSLGPRILRADTAAVAVLALVQAVLGDWA